MRYRWEQLADGVHRCRLAFCDVTVGLVWGSTGVLLIDTGSALTEAAAIDADVRQLAGRAVTHVVLTHKHFDHVLGSSQFTDAEIYCAPEVLDYLVSGKDELRADALRHGADATEVDRAVAALQPPSCGVQDAVVDLGGRTARVTHPGRGHTTSDLIVVLPGRRLANEPTVVFTGDLVEESADPCVDEDSDLAAWPATLDRMLATGGNEAIYVPGHGRAVDASFIRSQRDWLGGLGTSDN